MYLRKISIRNFRVFGGQGVDVTFKNGVNAIIGENNSGKSAIMDAIRIALSTVPYRRDIFFRKSDFHVNHKGQVANEAQFDLFFENVPNYLIDIWDPEEPSKGEFHIQFYLTKTPSGLEKVKYKAWGGKVEGNTLSPETFDAINVAFLGALRDAEGEMRPSRSSKLASLLSAVVPDDENRAKLVKVLADANRDILSHEPIRKTKEIINSNLLGIERELLRQQVDIGLVDPRFESITASLKTWITHRWFFFDEGHLLYNALSTMFAEGKCRRLIKRAQGGLYVDVEALVYKEELPDSVREELSMMKHSFELHQNGLGYNNLLFMSTVLGDMSYERPEVLHNLFLIEEPEAHLHPQLQGLVHSFFEKKHQNSASIQVIYTSHSPTLVSKIGLNAINLLYEDNFSIKSHPFADSGLSAQESAYLERFLDVTKSQMFFGKGVIFVEGISEALLIPEMAKCLDRSLDKYAVEVVNVAGTSFKPFIKILDTTNGKNFAKASIVTDDDRCIDKDDSATYIGKDLDFDDDISGVHEKLTSGTPSERYMNMEELCSGKDIALCGATKTLEYELAKHPNNIAYLIDVIKTEFPKVGPRLEEVVNAETSVHNKAVRIWLFLRARDKSKAQIAQGLCNIIKNQNDAVQKGCLVSRPFMVPGYIKRSIYAVTEEVSCDEGVDPPTE